MLFQRLNGLINTDVNGALNILRKIIDDSFIQRQLLLNIIELADIDIFISKILYTISFADIFIYNEFSLNIC